MTIDPQTIGYLERLARIELNPEERERLAGELGRIIEYASELGAVDTVRTPPGPATDPGSSAPQGGDFGAKTLHGLRGDVPRECLDRGAVLEEAPDTDERRTLFRVPRVIDR
jgi:Asp-tRNA(Asn)/Glu-tRNA(Gln) amidotransferase C subunit